MGITSSNKAKGKVKARPNYKGNCEKSCLQLVLAIICYRMNFVVIPSYAIYICTSPSADTVNNGHTILAYIGHL